MPVNTRRSDDVQKVVIFAGKHNLRAGCALPLLHLPAKGAKSVGERPAREWVSGCNDDDKHTRRRVRFHHSPHSMLILT